MAQIGHAAFSETLPVDMAKYPCHEPNHHATTKTEIEGPLMSRYAHPFACTACGKWNSPMLDETMDGNYILECGNPACKHRHHRHIKKGVVTDTRHQSHAPVVDVIHVLQSQISDAKPAQGVVSRMRSFMASGLLNGSNDT